MRCNSKIQYPRVTSTEGEACSFLDSIDPFDEYSFQIRPHHYWLPESAEDEINRLEMNLAIYEQYLLNSEKFTEHINKARTDDFNRLRTLKQKVA